MEWGIIVKEEGVMLNNVVCGAWNRAENVSGVCVCCKICGSVRTNLQK